VQKSDMLTIPCARSACNSRIQHGWCNWQRTLAGCRYTCCASPRKALMHDAHVEPNLPCCKVCMCRGGCSARTRRVYKMLLTVLCNWHTYCVVDSAKGLVTITFRAGEIQRDWWCHSVEGAVMHVSVFELWHDRSPWCLAQCTSSF
jgi:hypothetical protein